MSEYRSASGVSVRSAFYMDTTICLIIIISPERESLSTLREKHPGSTSQEPLHNLFPLTPVNTIEFCEFNSGAGGPGIW